MTNGLKQYDAEKIEELLGEKEWSHELPVSTEKIIGESRLLVIVGNGVFKRAYDVTDPADFEAVRIDISNGRWTSYKLYAASPEQLEQCAYQDILY